MIMEKSFKRTEYKIGTSSFNFCFLTAHCLFIGNSEIELGQGLLDLIYEMYKDINNTKL